MKRIYVNKKSELTDTMRTMEAAGLKCYRVRTLCECDSIGQGNRRYGVLALDDCMAIAEVVRCKSCTRRHTVAIEAQGTDGCSPTPSSMKKRTAYALSKTLQSV